MQIAGLDVNIVPHLRGEYSGPLSVRWPSRPAVTGAVENSGSQGYKCAFDIDSYYLQNVPRT